MMNRTTQGFTLVETLVAITVIMIALIGPFYGLQHAISYSEASRDTLIAESLAQEGMEFVYSVRDDNYLDDLQSPGDRTWLASLDGTQGGTNTHANCYNANGCMVDPTQETVEACTSDGCTWLRLSDTGLYTQDTSYNPTPFTRTVKLTKVTDTQTNVTVTVTWSTNRIPYSTSVTDSLYNWL